MNKEKFLVILREKGFLLVFALILTVGILLRLLLIKLPLWYDEGCSLLGAAKVFPFGINDYLFNKDFQHTPVYFYYLHFWIKFFGQSDISIRLSSLIPSLFTLPLVYIVARQVASRSVALISMFLMSTSVFQIFYSSEVRMYPIAVLFSLLSINSILRFIKDFKFSQIVENVFYNTILTYLMIGAPVFIVAQIMCLISYLAQAQRKEEIAKVLKANIFLIILLIPYFMILSKYFLVRHNFLVFHSVDLTFFNIIGVFQKFISQYVSNALYWVTTQPYVIETKEFVMFLVPLFVMLFAFYRAVIKNDEKIKFLSSLFFITFLIFVLTAQFKVVVLSPRYLIYISPVILILCAIGISTFEKKKIALFLAFWFFAGVFYLINEKEVVNYKINSLYVPSQYIKKLNMQPSDMVIMPFGSSVIGHYLGQNSPKVLNFEGIQEFRNIENSKIYSTRQRELLKMLDKSKMFSEIIIPDTNISKEFENYITSELSSVPVNGQLLFILTGTDRLTYMNDYEYAQYFQSVKIGENNLMFALLTEFNHTLGKILKNDFELVSTYNDEWQLYVLYKRVK